MRALILTRSFPHGQALRTWLTSWGYEAQISDALGETEAFGQAPDVVLIDVDGPPRLASRRRPRPATRRPRAPEQRLAPFVLAVRFEEHPSKAAAPWVASADLEVDGTDPSAVRQALMRGRLARSGPLALAALSIVEMPPDPHRPVQHELERTGPAGVDASLTSALRAGHALVRRSEQGQAITTDELEALMALLREGVDHVRALSHTFRAPGAGACPLVPALQDLLASAQRAAGFTGRLDVEAAWPPFKESAVRHLIRIAQEAVTHALKHAQARHLVLRVGQEGGRLFLQIEDDGAGRPTGAQQAAHGLGLRTMQYRAACLGARLTVETPPSGGTSVTCWLPPLPGLVVEAASTTVFPSPAPPRAHVSPLHCG